MPRSSDSTRVTWRVGRPRSQALPSNKLPLVCQQYFANQEQQNIATFLPGDTHRGLRVDTEFSGVTNDLCLLPVYVMNYQYKDRSYRFVINGQTGLIAGKRPVSSSRIALAIALGIGGVLLLVGLILGVASLVGAMAR
ncbi:MAG: hypothetical protein R3B96_05135 [Pirellulaceae bacterium]